MPSLIILGCSETKRLKSRLLPAIERYDGPVFRVLRRNLCNYIENAAQPWILSARFGLIPADLPIPWYDRSLRKADQQALKIRVAHQLDEVLDTVCPDRTFVSVGRSYWPLLEDTLEKRLDPAGISIALGGIGGRASQLSHWLNCGQDKVIADPFPLAGGHATLLGKTVTVTTDAVLKKAQEASLTDYLKSRRFETWYVQVREERVAPKWLVSMLFDIPVARFRTADARRVLLELGVPCQYAGNH